MKCPICKVEIPEGDNKCSGCGYTLNSEKKEMKEKKLFFRKKKVEAAAEESESKSKTKLKLIFALIGVLIIALIVAIIVGTVNANRGRRLAEDLSEAIGRSVAVAEKNAKVELIEESDCAAANKLMLRQGASYLYESSKEVEVDGVSYPKWLIYVIFDEKSDISKIEYYDFDVLEKNYKGEKAKAEIDTSQIVLGDKKKDIDKMLKIDPSKIEYTADTIKCCYNYYFINDDGDEEAKAFYIMYSSDEKVISVYRVDLKETLIF